MAFVWGLLRYPTLAAEPEPGASYSYGTFPLFLGKAVAEANRPLGIRRFLPRRPHAHGAVRHGNRPARVRDRLAALVAASRTPRRAALCAHRAPDPARPLLDRRPIPDLLQRRNPLSVDQDRPLGWSGQLSPLWRCDRPRAREQGDCTDTGRVAGCGGRAAGGHFGPRPPDCGADQLSAGKGHPRARRLRGGRIRRVSGRPALRLRGPAHLGHRTGRTLPRRPARAASADQRQRRLSAVRPVGAPPELRLSAREHPLLGARGSAGARGDRGRRLRGLPSLPRRRYEAGPAARAGRHAFSPSTAGGSWPSPAISSPPTRRSSCWPQSCSSERGR